ncbi:MAG TPA: hypothetical protein VLI54_05215 [Bacillota bacterium]|nr:hypothetical protein [Bacillota bacterium]
MTPNSTVEYERTFLAREIPVEVKSSMPERVVDFYVPDAPDIHPTVRLRKRGSTHEITKKSLVSGTDSSQLLEETIGLTQKEFESLTSGHNRMVEKDRYKVIISGRPAEVDIFSGKLEGLVIIDFEFLNNSDKAAFTPPPCCLAEVTQEITFAGGNLAGKSYDNISTVLTKFGYQKLAG